MPSPRRILLIAVRLALSCVGLALLASSAPVFAQAGEAHGFVEPCTIGNHQEMHTECELCAIPEKDEEACSRRLDTLGYAKKCRTNIHSGPPAEVWCADKAVLAAKAAPVKKSESTGKLIIAIALSVALVGAFFFAKRRRSA